MRDRELADFFFSGRDEDSYEDGTGSSDVGPRYCISNGASGATYPEKPKDQCRCRRPSVNRFTQDCHYHQELHEKWMALVAGKITRDEYEGWLKENPAI